MNKFQKAIDHASLKDLLEPILNLYNEIQQKATLRLTFDKRDNAEAVMKPGGVFYQNPGGYAMDVYAYYMCHKCKTPYFGGEAHCELAMEGNVERKAEDFVCGLCSEATRTKVSI